jgi:D-alanyl-lipoteichoic acid acyltransferase DltB (MBOAT superfamily)
MLFNSFPFIFGFLPLALGLFYLAGLLGRGAKLVLTLASLIFYAVWRPIHLPLLLGSIIFNYGVGDRIQKAVAAERTVATRVWLILGLAADLSFLGWFKYANFVADNISLLTGEPATLAKIALPLGISFFTFQKIAYLIDSARGEAKKIGFLDFALFAAFFPQLIAGPIVHFKEVVPQLQTRRFGHINWRNLLVGLVIFAIGLFKKTVIADTLASYATPMFAHTGGVGFTLIGGWLAAITFTFQLYFDFSGYSDMAIGLGRMLGVKLPLNFHSPLRASNIADYWRRWHMTLQRFIVAYIFQPLSLPMNRWAASRGLRDWPAFTVGVGVPAFVTFVAVGLWHGAGWTFVLFGVMHATYICINEAWLEWRKRRRRQLRKLGLTLAESGPARMALFHTITLVAVVYANVMFRSGYAGGTVANAVEVWKGMTGLNGVGVGAGASTLTWGLAASLVLSVVLVFLMPNTQQIMGRFDPAYNWGEWRDVAKPPLRWTWTPNVAGLMFAAVTLLGGILFIQRGKAIFLYFNF